MTDYYRLSLDTSEEDLWILDDPQNAAGAEVEGWHFKMGRRYDERGKLRIPVYCEGRTVPFSFNVSNAPVVATWLLDILEPLLAPTIQRVPAEVDTAEERYEILNILDVVDCVDEQRSELTKWAEDDSRPDKVGDYRSIRVLKIDPERAAGHRMFRLKGSLVEIIVDGNIKGLLNQNAVPGIVFEDVS